MEYVCKSATMNTTENYRYRLIRVWDRAKPQLCYIMLNPSTADGTTDDATIRKCVGYAKQQGYGGIVVVNLFAYRATNPKALRHPDDPVGFPENDDFIRQAVEESVCTIAAWGAHGKLNGRNLEVIKLLGGQKKTIYCLGQTKDGHPKHPLYVPYDVKPMVYIDTQRGNRHVRK